MGFIRFVLWTSLCVGLGVVLASYPISGKTPLEHAQGLWKAKAAGLAIHERLTPEDREEVNRLIAKRATAK